MYLVFSWELYASYDLHHNNKTILIKQPVKKQIFPNFIAAYPTFPFLILFPSQPHPSLYTGEGLPNCSEPPICLLAALLLGVHPLVVVLGNIVSYLNFCLFENLFSSWTWNIFRSSIPTDNHLVLASWTYFTTLIQL